MEQTQEKLYPCCNTCKHKTNNFYQCNIPKKCFNGFSAYEPNDEMKIQYQTSTNADGRA